MNDQANSNFSVLIVEDERAHAELLRIYLTETGDGWIVNTVSSLSEYEKVINSISPTIILADINLPDGSSLSIVKNERHFPVLLMTSYADNEVSDEVHKSGAAGFIIKTPDSFRNIKSIISDTLAKWKAES